MIDDLSVLRDILARRGFGAAASNLQARDLRNIRDTIRMWEDYPKNMEQYPTHLRNRREVEWSSSRPSRR